MSKVLKYNYSGQSITYRGTVTSVISTPNNDENMIEIDEALRLEEKEKTRKANLKRYFYTLIANAKKILGPKNIGYYVNSGLLFKEVIKEKKSVDEWVEFITKELNTQPSKWIESKKLSKIQALYYLYNHYRIMKKTLLKEQK